MKTFNEVRLHQCPLHAYVIIFYFMRQVTCELDDGPLVWKPAQFESAIEDNQRDFLKVHPNPSGVMWPQMKNLTRKSHRRICDHVLPSILPPHDSPDNFHYQEAPSHMTIKSARYVARAILPLPDLVAHIPVLKCYYEEMKFYITPADDKHVFQVYREPNTHIYKFGGKSIAIDYDELLAS